MPSTYTGNLGIELPADGELDGVWGDVVNDNMNIIDRAVNGSLALALSGTSSTLTTSDGSLSDGQYKLLVLGGSPSGTHTITIAPNDAQKIYFVRNTTAQSVVFTQGSGGNVTVATGDSAIIYSDGAGAGAAVINITNDFAMSSVKITGGTIDGTVIGGTSAAAGTFTTANATTVDTTNIEVTTLKAKDGTSAGSIADSTGVVTLASSVLTTTDINGGTIDGTAIGGSSAAAGTFTTVAASGVASFADGSAAAPSIAHTGDLNAGLFFPAADTVAVSTAGTERMRITSAGLVGIGVTPNSAWSTFKVLQLSTVGSLISNDFGSNNAQVVLGSNIYFDSGFAYRYLVSSTSASRYQQAVGAHIWYNAPSGTAGDAITFTQAMTLDASGNLGIATTSPTNKLDVNGNIGLPAATTEGRGIEIGVGRTGNGNTFIDFIGDATYTDYGLRIIRAAGVNAASTMTHRGTGNLQIITEDAAALTFQTSLTERMRIDSSGNVGIGTTSPVGGLHINTATRTLNLAALASGAGGASYIMMGNSDSGGTAGPVVISSSNRNLAFNVGDSFSSATGGTLTEYMRISNAGNLGIGNTAPVTKLHVTGASITTGVTYLAQPAQTSKAAAATLTIAELLTGIVQYTGAVATLTLPTGTLIEGGLPATFPTNMSFDVSFINTGAALLTIGTATDLTLVGTMTVATLTSAMLRFRKTATNTYTVYRIS